MRAEIGNENLVVCLSLQHIILEPTGVKITRGPWARGPYLGGRAPKSPSLGARQAPRNVRGQNIAK